MSNKQTIYNLHLDNGEVLEVRSSKTKQQIENDNLNIPSLIDISHKRSSNGVCSGNIVTAKCIKVTEAYPNSTGIIANSKDFLNR
jgi:hypothetical protein